MCEQNVREKDVMREGCNEYEKDDERRRTMTMQYLSVNREAASEELVTIGIPRNDGELVLLPSHRISQSAAIHCELGNIWSLQLRVLNRVLV